MTLYKEIFRVRQQIAQLKNKLGRLETTCLTRGSRKSSSEISKMEDELEHLNVRKHVLDKICAKGFIF